MYECFIPIVLLLGLWYSREVTDSLSLPVAGAPPNFNICISIPSSGLLGKNKKIGMYKRKIFNYMLINQLVILK